MLNLIDIYIIIKIKGIDEMYNRCWSRKELTSKKLGEFAEYYAKMALASYGMDIYTSEVDDHGIDFVAESSKGFLKFQVKSVRNFNYVGIKKEVFDVSDDFLFLILLLLNDNEDPAMYIIPASTWKDSNKKVFVSREYATPEYGINNSVKNLPVLEKFKIEKMIESIL